MSDFVDSGVSGSVSEPTGSTDSGSSVPQAGTETNNNSQGESFDLQQQGQGTVETAAAPPAEVEIPENDDDLAHLSERERTPLLNQRQRLRELNASRQEAEAYKAQVEPAETWITERGGGDFEMGLAQVQADVGMLDSLLSDQAGSIDSFWNELGQQDPGAYERVFENVVSSPYVINHVAHSLTNEQIMQLAEHRGLQLANAAGVDDRPEDVTPEVWQAMAPEVREGFYDMARKVQDWHIADAKQKAQTQAAQKAQWQQQQQQQRAAQETQREQAKTHALTTVRSAVEKSLASLYPNNPEAVKDILRITEQVIRHEDGEAKAAWDKIEGHIDEDQIRQVRLELPNLISKAKLIASKISERNNTRDADARKWQELMRQASPNEILEYVQRVRGGQKQPQPGTGTTVTTNGNTRLPNPEKAGQYSRENIASYIVRN